MMTVEQIAQATGCSLLSTIRGVANLIEKGLIAPGDGVDPKVAVAELRARERSIAAAR